MKNTTNHKTVSNSLARLLATENLKIVYSSKAETASFNVKSRLLTMPTHEGTVGKDEKINELMLSHEVGHALYTPANEKVIDDAIRSVDSNNPKRVHSFLNIIEDARIERKMQNMYPGLRKTFALGYKALVEQTELFDYSSKGKIGSLPLIDRINIYFKVASNLGVEVPFSPTEQEFVNRIHNSETFEDVVGIVKDIYTFSKQQEEEEKESSQEGDNKDGDGKGNRTGGIHFIDGMSQRELDKALNAPAETKGRWSADNRESAMVTIPRYIPHLGTITTNTLVERLEGSKAWGNNEIINSVQKYNRSAVSCMVSDFERKKSASEFQRSSTSQIGILDMTRIHQYRHEDNLFLTNIDIRKGKSHGIVFVVDWSSSMGNRMFSCLVQLSSLISFCRAVKIPYEVYGFSSSDNRAAKNGAKGCEKINYDSCWTVVEDEGENVCSLDSLFSMIQISSNTVPLKTENNILSLLLLYHFNGEVASCMGIDKPYDLSISIEKETVCDVFVLSGTPLEETTLACVEIVSAFRAKHNLELVNTMFLTDGDSTSNASHFRSTESDNKNDNRNDGDRYMNSSAEMITYHYRGGTYFLPFVTMYELGKMFRNILRDITGTNLINFFMEDMHRFNRIRKRFDHLTPATTPTTLTIDDDFIEERNYNGWDSQFIISFERDQQESNKSAVELRQASTVVKIKNAFIRSMNRATSSRILLNRVTDYLTKQANLVSAKRKQSVLNV